MGLQALIVAVVLSVGAAGPAHAQVTGSAAFEGDVPSRKELRVEVIRDVARMHKGPVLDESLIVSATMQVRNVVVYVDGPNLGGAIPAATAVLDIRGAVYAPHVVAVMVGQRFEARNSDAFLHNPNSLSQLNGQLNLLPGVRAVGVCGAPNGVADRYVVKCDVHPWMKAWVVVLEHPYFAVTGEDGAFSIDTNGLKDGAYTLTAWHERMGVQKAEVKVTNGKSGPVEFKFALKKSGVK